MGNMSTRRTPEFKARDGRVPADEVFGMGS
jgi:hypothetical protein